MDEARMSPSDHGSGTLEYGVPPDGVRLPADTKLGRVRLQVADLARSLSYYQEVLGLQVLETGGAEAVLGTSSAPDGDSAPLLELQERVGVAPVPRRGRLGLFHFAILLPQRADLGRFAAHLSARGEPVGASDHRVSEALYLHDPDGLGIEVYADRPRKAWRREGRQLVMATDPLDVEDLLRAGKGATWAGMPPDTIMGHIHLHVGDLVRAEAFYHQALGLDKVVWSYPGALFLSAGGYHHHLGLNTWAAGAPPAGEADARLLEWELRVPSAGAAGDALERLADEGHPVERSPGGGTVRDPWGTVMRIRG
jgi:catechol 2,3-dioxygenase